MRVSSGEKAIGELVHLAFETVCGEGLGTRRPVFVGERCGVAPLEGSEGEENLHDRGHIAAVEMRSRKCILGEGWQIGRTCCRGSVDR
jgi:hypothetical protein